MLTASYAPFSHLIADRAALYRAVLDVFVAARGRFRSYLRPRDVVAELRARGHEIEAADDLLDQLVRWGNLSAHPDTAEVATIEEFYRARFLYQLSRAGEAVEEAMGVYVEALQRTGELQAAALDDVRRSLMELLALSEADPLDPAAVYTVLSALAERFGGLVEQARTFMGALQRAVDLHGAEAEALLTYKDRLIQYLERFIGQLVAVSADVSGLLARLAPDRVARLAGAAARRDLEDRLDRGPEAELAATELWASRLDGIHSWFESRDGSPSQAEELRRRAREAIPALLAAIAAHHDRRMTRSDRVQDLRTLARWFDEAPDDDAAHQLWRAAFTLTPARHLSVDPTTLGAWEDAHAGPATRWADAPALEISPRLRATGRHNKPGRLETIVDRSQERAKLERRRRDEAAAMAEAEALLVTGRPFRLSDLPELGEAAFELLLELLGDAISSGRGEASSADGRFVVILEAPWGGALATVQTARGALHGPDYQLTVWRAGQATASVAA